MPPKPPSRDFIIIAFILGSLPYFAITFGLDFPSPFSWLDKLCKFIADASLAFATAFPFWAVIEYVSTRTTNHRIATIQKNFIQQSTKEVNDLIRFACDDIGLHKESEAYLLTEDLSKFNGLQFWLMLEKRYREMERHPDNHLESYTEALAFDFAVAINTIDRYLTVAEQYTSHYSEQYTTALTRMRAVVVRMRRLMDPTRQRNQEYWREHISSIRRVIEQLGVIDAAALYSKQSPS